MSSPAPHELEEGPRRWLSLERRLPLMISGLLTAFIAAFGFFAWSEVRQSSTELAMARMRTVLGQAVDLLSRTYALRFEASATTASSPAVAALFASGAGEAERERATAYLMSRRISADSLLGAQFVFDRNGRRLLFLGTEPVPDAMSQFDRVARAAMQRDSTEVGRLFSIGNEVHYWSVFPVWSNAKVIGYLAEYRWVRSARNLNELIKRLTGQDMTLYLTSAGSNRWMAVGGEPMPPLFDLAALPDSFHVQGTDGVPVMGGKGNIRGTPWVLLFTVTQADVNARSVVFLQRMVAIGVILLAVGMLSAWLMSRRVTRPLVSLTTAARAIADGDFARRESATTNDELGELARAFNTMAERIGQSHMQLASRIDESEALARQLHTRNEQLDDARRWAEQARAEAQQASKAKTEFMAMMSHELRTPLSAIAGYAEILELGIRGDLNEAQRLDVSRIRANQQHLLRIISDILDLTQVESGQLSVDVKPVALRDVLADLEPIVLPLIDGRDLHFQVHPDAHRYAAMADRERLTQVLVNLVANAVRFSESGADITVRAEPRTTKAVVRDRDRDRDRNHVGDGVGERRLLLHVSDTGIGIAPDKLELVFQPFVQVESGASRRAHGTGLGLAISRRIVEAMGGTLTVASALGVGSTFTIDLAEATVADDRGVAAGRGASEGRPAVTAG